MSVHVFLACQGFVGTHRAQIIGFLQSNGAADVHQSQVTHATDKPFAIVRCIDQRQYDRVIAACGAREFNRVEADGLRPFPVRARRFTE